MTIKLRKTYWLPTYPDMRILLRHLAKKHKIECRFDDDTVYLVGFPSNVERAAEEFGEIRIFMLLRQAITVANFAGQDQRSAEFRFTNGFVYRALFYLTKTTRQPLKPDSPLTKAGVRYADEFFRGR